MPKQYEAIRDKLIAEGLSKKAAEEHAAKIYNSLGKGHVGKGSKERKTWEKPEGCSTCGHYSYPHGPGKPCKGLDAAGDTCDCENRFVPERDDK